MQPHEYINRFCATVDTRLWLMRPARDNGKLYASDGRIMIQTADDPEVSAMDDSPLVGAFMRLMAQHIARDNWQAVAMTLPEKHLCTPCRGTGKLPSCDYCDGEGSFGNSEHWTCPECNGRGEWPDEKGDLCWHCSGTGEDFLAIPFAGTCFQRRYLALLLSLPGPVELSTTGPRSEAFFRFSGGYGALMPCRP